MSKAPLVLYFAFYVLSNTVWLCLLVLVWSRAASYRAAWLTPFGKLANERYCDQHHPVISYQTANLLNHQNIHSIRRVTIKTLHFCTFLSEEMRSSYSFDVIGCQDLTGWAKTHLRIKTPLKSVDMLPVKSVLSLNPFLPRLYC